MTLAGTRPPTVDEWEKADLIYSLNAGDVHWCVNAKGIKGVSCPSKAYGIMAASKPILGVLESGSEVRCLIEDTHGGFCCEPGEYDKVEENIRWFIENAGKGTVLGDGCVVGAGAVVAGKFEDNCVIAGNPAKVIKRLEGNK